MALNPEAKRILSTKMVPLIGCILLVYFGVHLLQGERGLLTYISLQNSMHEMKEEEAKQEARLSEIENKVDRLRPATFDKDFAEEQARINAGLMRADEQVIILDKKAE